MFVELFAVEELQKNIMQPRLKVIHIYHFRFLITIKLISYNFKDVNFSEYIRARSSDPDDYLINARMLSESGDSESCISNAI